MYKLFPWPSHVGGAALILCACSLQIPGPGGSGEKSKLHSVLAEQVASNVGRSEPGRGHMDRGLLPRNAVHIQLWN